MPDTALEIQSGAELERFIPAKIVINYADGHGHAPYLVLTGHENNEHRCFWCGGELKGKLKRYCRGHMVEYYRHFEWGYASHWCIERYDHRCANCGLEGLHNRTAVVKLEVHHIVPVNGDRQQFSAFHLPWNLICFCHDCHLEIGAAMRPEKLPEDLWERALQAGQILMPLNMGGIVNA